MAHAGDSNKGAASGRSFVDLVVPILEATTLQQKYSFKRKVKNANAK